MYRVVFGGMILASVFQLCWLSGCTVHVDEPADTRRIDVEVERPPKVNVDVDVKRTNP